MIQTIVNQLQNCANLRTGRPSISAWHTSGDLQVFLRSGYCYFDPQASAFALAVAVANVAVFPKYRQRRVWSNFLQKLEENAKELGYSWLLVEQVNNEFLAASLLRRGYTSDEAPWSPTLRRSLIP